MYLIAVHSWRDDAVAVALLSEVLGLSAFEARQKLAGGGPAVVASYAGAERAGQVAGQLNSGGLPALLVESEALRRESPPVPVSRFELTEAALRYDSADGSKGALAYTEVKLLLVATCSLGPSQSRQEVTQKKFSLGKTVLAGGVPMTRKVTREEVTTADTRDQTLWVYGAGAVALVFKRGSLNFDGLGASRQLTRELNFNLLKRELRRLAPAALYDDRLLRLAAQTRLLGPALSPEANLDLAMAILSRSLLAGPAG
jgi:hypothetical protein